MKDDAELKELEIEVENANDSVAAGAKLISGLIGQIGMATQAVANRYSESATQMGFDIAKLVDKILDEMQQLNGTTTNIHETMKKIIVYVLGVVIVASSIAKLRIMSLIDCDLKMGQYFS